MSSSEAVDQLAERARAKKRAQTRAAILRQTVRWHWISAAICLVGMLLFAITGVTLNHAGAIEGSPKRTERTAEAPEPVVQALRAAGEGALPAEARRWAGEALDVRIPTSAPVEWSEEEAYVALPGPGSDAWVSIDLGSGDALYERTDRGPVAYLNDLHKGRNTGPAWSWFIDIFALGCVVFCVTGLILLQMHAHARRTTWPLVAVGLIIPLLLALFLIH